MSLTQEEKAELSSLQQMSAPQQKVGLSQDEQIELNQLQSIPSPETMPQFTEQQIIKNLRTADRAITKSSGMMQAAQFAQGIPGLPGSSTQPYEQEKQKGLQYKAEYDSLWNAMKARGKDESAVELALEVDRQINPTIGENMVDESGRMGGAIALGSLGAKVGAPFGPWTSVGLGILGTGIGSFVGSSTQDIATQRSVDWQDNLSDAGVDMLFETLFRGGSQTVKSLKGVAAKGTKSALMRGKRQEMLDLLQEFTTEGGGKYDIKIPIDELVDNVFADIGTSLASGSAGGSELYRRMQVGNQKEIMRMVLDSVQELTDDALPLTRTAAGYTILDRFARGTEPMQELGKGSAITKLDDLFNRLYSKLDESFGYTTKTVQETVTKTGKVLDASGKPIATTTKVAKNVLDGKAKVNISKLVSHAREKIRVLQHEAKLAGKKSWQQMTSKESADALDTISGWSKSSEKNKIAHRAVRNQVRRWDEVMSGVRGEAGVDDHTLSEIIKLSKDTMTDETLLSGVTGKDLVFQKNINTMYRNTMKLRDHLYTRQLMAEAADDPSVILPKLLPDAGTGDLSGRTVPVKRTIDSLMYGLDGKIDPVGKQGLNHLKATKMQEMIKASIVNIDSPMAYFDPSLFTKEVNKFGRDSSNMLFGVEYINKMKRMLKLSYGTQPSVRPGVVENVLGTSLRYRALGLQVTGAGLTGSGVYMMTSDDPRRQKVGGIMAAAGGSMMISPYYFAKINTTDKGRKLLLGVAETAPTHKSYAANVSKLIRWVNKEEAKDKQEVREHFMKQKRQEASDVAKEKQKEAVVKRQKQAQRSYPRL
jgi:hypothetical protein